MVQKANSTFLRGTNGPGAVLSFLPAAATSAAAVGKELCRPALVSLGRGRLFGYISPGPGWNWGLQRCMSSGPQRIRSSVEDRPGAVGLRQQCGGPKAPAKLARSKRFATSKARADMEGRVPPRPWARVEPGPPSNPYHRAGVEPGPFEGHGCGPNWRGRFHQLVRRVARRGSCWQATVVRSSGSRSRGITGPVPVTWPPLARVEEGHQKVDPPVCGHRIRDGMWASAIRSYGFGAFERSTIGVDSMTRGEGGPAWKQCLRAGLGPAATFDPCVFAHAAHNTGSRQPGRD